MIPLSVGQMATITGAAQHLVADPAAMVTGPVIIDSRQAPWPCSPRAGPAFPR